MASIRENVREGRETTWSVLYRHGTKQSSKTIHDHREAARLRDLINLLGVEKGLKAWYADDAPAQGITVAELWGRFIEWKSRPVDRGGLTPRTLADYQRDWANWLEPWFGHRTADEVDEADVQKWVDHMARQLSPKTVADRHMLLHQAYDFGRARSRQLVEHNPCKETQLPKRGKRKPPKGTTTPEFRALRRAAAEVKGNPDAADLILFLGETGWRFSEATALDVRAVEDDGTDVWVDMSRVFRLDGSGRQYLVDGEAKSQAGFRRIRMFPDTAAMLRRRVVGRAPGDLVLTNSRGRQWNQNTFLRSTWPGIVAAAHLGDRKPTPHWLRHMHVAVLAASGAPMHEIQRRIGHEHYSTTVDVYGGMIGDIGDDAMAKAAALMAGERSAPNIAPVVAGEVVETVVGEVLALD